MIGRGVMKRSSSKCLINDLLTSLQGRHKSAEASPRRKTPTAALNIASGKSTVAPLASFDVINMF